MDFIKYLVSSQVVGDKLPILCNQENFILKGNSYKLFQTLPNYNFIINPALKNSLDRGRPKNGMFIAFPNKIKNFVTDVSPGHWRVQAAIISSPKSRTLLINSYFPFDKREGERDENDMNNDELNEVIGVINNVINNNDADAVIWTGDINADFLRDTRQSRIVKESIESLNFFSAWNRFQADFTCTYEREGITYISLIDHFFWSEQLNHEITDAGVIHHPDNESDHSPIYCVFKSLTLSPSITVEVPQPPKPSWKQASIMEKNFFKYMLDVKLNSIVIPTILIECENLHCKDHIHLEAVDWLTTEILNAIQSAAEETIPFPKPTDNGSNKRYKTTPGFTDRVKQYKDKALFWHSIWKSAGRPMNTELHNIMKKTRNVYHMEYKKCRKAEATIKKSKLLDACLNGNGDIFKEIKAMRKTKPVCADSIDGVTNDIPNHFSNIYSELYNCVDDGDEVANISEEVEKLISDECIVDVKKVTSEVVKKAAAKLKPGKGDPSYTFSSDCLKVDSDVMAEYIAIMLRSFLIHGHIPQFLLLSTLVPIIKDKLGPINSSKNYRSVCITALVLKLLDWIIIILFGDVLGFHDLQFAYQPGISANMCTWAVIETVDYFLRNDSEVFGCSMDKSKAFDLCKFSILFRKMLKNLSLVFLRIIIFMYVNQFSNVRWNSTISSSFSISNGVGQGKILAGFAYCYYCYDLSDNLKSSGYGCTINGVYAGIAGYSDDDLMLAPSISALQGMLKIAEDYATQHGLKFSTDPNPKKSKTKCISFLLNPRPLPKMRLCGNLLPWVDSIVHLGNTITNDTVLLEHDMSIKKARYISKNIELNQELHFAASQTKIHVNNIYNNSWFGNVMWNLFSPACLKLESCYNRSIKIMMDLPLETHRGLIEPISKSKHIKRIFIKNFIQFIAKIDKSAKPLLRTLLMDIKYDTRSTTGRNLRGIMLLSNKTSIDDITVEDGDHFPYCPRPEEDNWKIEMLIQLMEERDRGYLEDEDLEWVNYLCTS